MISVGKSWEILGNFLGKLGTFDGYCQTFGKQYLLIHTIMVYTIIELISSVPPVPPDRPPRNSFPFISPSFTFQRVEQGAT